jgi:hypothetical protein
MRLSTNSTHDADPVRVEAYRVFKFLESIFVYFCKELCPM